MTWFPLYLLALVVLRLFATPRDRKALSILLVAGFASTLLAHTVMPEIHASWKLVIPGAVETLTIWALVMFAERNLVTFSEVVLLLIAWLCHLLCYVDCETGSNFVYDNYEHILAAVAIGQILAFYDTAFSMVRSVQRWFNFWANRIRGVPAASLSADVLHRPGRPGV